MRELMRQEHRVIVEALGLMDHAFLSANHCWFGGGTAIVLKLGEYRQSLDVDFLCSDADGYRELRSAAVEKGIRAFFPEPVESLRSFKIDQYGLRAALLLHGQTIKFEIIREARIDVQGHFDEQIGIPTLVVADMFAEKLLANADRCHDRSIAYRDAIDLGMLVRRYGSIPDAAVQKTVKAYGQDIERKLVWVINRLQDDKELRHAADVLNMSIEDAFEGIAALKIDVARIWPEGRVEAE